MGEKNKVEDIMISSNKKKWKITCERYIAFFDIMGFKDYIYRNSHSIVEARMNTLFSIIKSVEYQLESLTPMHDIDDDIILMTTFSDSIMLVSKDSSRESFIFMTYCAQQLLNKSISSGIPMKGAIAFGTQTADFEKSMFYGKALIDAYQLQEDLQLYSCLIHHTAEKEEYLNHISPQYLQLKVPTKKGKITHYVCAWPYTVPHSASMLEHSIRFARESMKKFYITMSGYPRVYVDNTLTFLDEVEEVLTDSVS